MDNKITFSQQSQPSIKAGKYTINVNTSSTIPAQFKAISKEIVVTSNRFQLKPDDVYSVYPQQNAIGEYNESLPHIVLNRRTLPWEIDVLKTDSSVPWMALLVFDQSEGIEVIQQTVNNLNISDETTLTPKLKNIYKEQLNLSCNVIDIPVELALHILPYQDELSLLTHVKGVSLDDKVTDSNVTDSYFSTVVTNRLSRTPVDEEDSIKHLACLVSIEGYDNLIIDSSSREKHLAAFKQIRFIVLSSWNYYIAKKTFDFKSTVEKLDVDVISTFQMRLKEDVLSNEAEQRVEALRKLAYFPMNHHFRDGSRLVSWYQSPFIPYIEVRATYECAMFSDQLLNYDPKIGMMDITYAGAWQLGRSLALADLAFATQIMAWRKMHQELYFKSLHTSFIQNQLYQVQLLTRDKDMNQDDKIAPLLEYIKKHYPSKQNSVLQQNPQHNLKIQDNFKMLIEEMMKNKSY